MIIKNYHQLKGIYQQCQIEGLYLNIQTFKHRVSTWKKIQLDDNFVQNDDSITTEEFDQLRRWLVPINKRMIVFKGLNVEGHFLEYEDFAFVHYPKSDYYEIYLKANETLEQLLHEVELLSHNRHYHMGIKAA
jgi:hypothetical protein